MFFFLWFKNAAIEP